MTVDRTYSLSDLTRARAAYKTARVELEAQIREQVRKKLEGLQREQDLIAFTLHQQGESKRKIALEGLGTKALITASQSIDRGRMVAMSAGLTEDKGEGGINATWLGKDSNKFELKLTGGQVTQAQLLAARMDVDLSDEVFGTFIFDEENGTIDPVSFDFSNPAVLLFLNDKDFEQAVADWATSNR